MSFCVVNAVIDVRVPVDCVFATQTPSSSKKRLSAATATPTEMSLPSSQTMATSSPRTR